MKFETTTIPLTQEQTVNVREFWEGRDGTGGSMLIIGSAAGVAAMGLEHINFFWYLRKISWLALVGFVAGAVTYILQMKFLY